MDSSRPRSASLPVRSKDDSWAQPSSWNGRKPSGSAQDQRTESTKLSPFGSPPPFAGTHRSPSRTVEALDLAKPTTSTKHGALSYNTLPSFKDVAKAMKAGGSKHGLDSHLLAKALGGDAKLAANIEKRMQAHQDKHAALMNDFMSKGFSALHTMPGHVMKDVNKQLSAFQPPKKSLFGSLKSKK